MVKEKKEKIKKEVNTEKNFSMDVFDIDGKVVENISLNPDIFGAKINERAIYQVYWAYNNNARVNIAHTKTRGEISGGGRKPYKQKHTGRARQGSIRSPIWRGGGIVFGPRSDRNYKTKINDKTKKAVLRMILTAKYQDNEIRLVNDLKLQAAKTKQANIFLGNMVKSDDAKESRAKVLVTLNKASEEVDQMGKAFRNLKNVSLVDIKNMSVMELMRNKFLIMDKSCLDIIQERLLK